jgi:hypothetical protein
MGVRKDRHGQSRYRKRIRLHDGTLFRVKGTPALNTKADAEQAERAHIERALRGALGPDAQPKEVLTLAKFVEEIWWPKYKLGGGKRGVNSVTTLMGKESNLRVHILPQLGALKLDKITNERVTEFFGRLREQGYGKKGRRTLSQKAKAVQKRKERLSGRKDRGLPRKGLSEKSVKNIRTTLHTILVFAVKWGRLSRMPDLPEVAVPESSFDWYRPEEAAALISATQDSWQRALLMFPLHTGVRLGEQRAMRWTGVDFKLNRVHIRRSAPKGLDIEKAPKSNRQRWVDLTPELSSAPQAIRPLREGHAGIKGHGRRSDLLQGGRIEAAAWSVSRGAMGRTETGGPSSHQVARAAALLRVDPRVGRHAALRAEEPAWALLDRNDRALLASRDGGSSELRAPLGHSSARSKWAPSGPETSADR